MSGHEDAGHECGPGAGCVNPRYSVTLGPFAGQPLMVVVVSEDSDSPSGTSAVVEGRVVPERVADVLRQVADQYEAQYRARLS